MPHEISSGTRYAPYGSWGALGASDAEIDAAIQFGPVPADDPARAAAGVGGGAATGAAAGAILGPIGAAVGAIVGAAPGIVGLAQSIKAKRGTLAGLMSRAAATRAKLMTAKRPAKRQKLMTKYQGLVQQIKAQQAEIAAMEQQAAMQNIQVSPTPPPYGLYTAAGLGVIGLGALLLFRKKR